MKHLYFVRHGLSVMNKQGIFSGRTETPLAAEGIEQCHAVGKSLRDAGIDCIVASPIKRAYNTAEIIAHEIGIDPANIVTHEAFIERNFGPIEGTPYAPNTKLDDIEGVEHSEELIARVREGLEFLKTLDANSILVVSHGAVGRALRHLVSPDLPFNKAAKFYNAQAEKLI